MLSNTNTPIYYSEFRDRVVRGQTPVNEFVSAHMNHIDELIENPKYYYDDRAIEGYIKFCNEELVLTNGDDMVLIPTFKLWAEDLLAWYYYEDEIRVDPKTNVTYKVRKKKRLRKRQFIITSRSSAKTVYVYSIHAYGLVVDTTTTLQIATAPTVVQSLETLSTLSTAISRSRGPLFKALTKGNKRSNLENSQPKLQSTKEGIVNRITNSKLITRPMRRDALQGFRSKYNSVDEWLSGDIKEDVIGALEQNAAKGGEDEYVVLAISSEGTVRDKVGDSIKMQLLKILRGEYEDNTTSIWYYRLDDLSEIHKPEMWEKACPNIGITVSYDVYARDVERAEHDGAVRNDILAKRFGIPVEGWTYFFTYDEIQLHPKASASGLPCTMGMDASQGDDFWAFTWLFPLGEHRFALKTRAYVSSVKYDMLPIAIKNKYDEFIEEGSLIVLEGPLLDWEEIYEDVVKYILEQDWSILGFGYDPYNAEAFVNRWVQENGSYGTEKVRQGVRTESVPLGEIKKVSENRSLMFDEELMKFSMGNAIALQDNNGNYKLSKERRVEKIDNVSALVDAWVVYNHNKEVFN